MKLHLPVYITRLFCAAALCTALGCAKKEVVDSCYTCTSLISYSTDSPTFDLGKPIYSPSRVDKRVCDENEKKTLEMGTVTSQSLGGTYTLKKTAQTVCVKKPI